MTKFLLIASLVVSLFWALIPQVIFLVSWLVARVFHYRLHWMPWLWASLGVVALWWCVYFYGNQWGRFRFETKEVEHRFHHLPHAFDGYRIVHISDLHLDGWKGHSEDLERIVNKINALQPDLICFTGDLISMSEHELDNMESVLSRLQATDGVVSVLGNHDYMPYSRQLTEKQRTQSISNLVQREEEMGWRLLLNQHHIIHRDADSLAIIGVENHSCGTHNIIHRGRLSEAMTGCEHTFSILLSHDPTHWRAEVVPQTNIPLTLSGHTHAMQFRLFGWTPSRYIYPECDGLYTKGEQTLYVNIGLGGTMPMRIGATPEITLHILRANE